jgi:hypothetical protein
MDQLLFRFYFFVFIITPFFSFGQKQIISGYVVDKNKTPLSYVNIVSVQNKIGTTTNELGYYSIKLDISDSIKFTHIAFSSKVVPVIELIQDNVVVLDEEHFFIDEIVIRSRFGYKQKEKLGYYGKDRNGSFVLSPGNQLAVFISNTKRRLALIESVSFQVKDKGKCNSKIRIRILEKETNNFSPGKDLLVENYIIDNKQLSHRNTINISESNIFLPEKGAFIVIEWVGVDSYCEDNSFPIIAANISTKENHLWYNYRDKQWSRAPRPVFQDNYMTPNVSITVYY